MEPGFGAFGKMPSAGDFFRVNLPGGFVTAWDDWIQRAMLTAAQRLGAAWDAHYMSAPIWRFSLSAGLVGPSKMIGVLMPSVDRVGRRFPLTLAAPLTTPGPAALDHFGADALFERLEEVALDALEDTMTREALAERLAALSPPEARGAAPLRHAGRSLVLTADGPGGFLPDLAAALLARDVAAPSLWSAVVDERPRLMVCNGLPDAAEVAALFDPGAAIWFGDRPEARLA